MDKVQSVLRPLQALFGKLTGVLQILGEKVFKLIGDYVQWHIGLYMKLFSVIKEKVIGALENMGAVGQWIIKIFERIGQTVGDFVNDGLETGKKIHELTVQIEKDEIKLTKRRAELNVEYEKSLELAKDITKSEEVRRAAARKAQEAQEELLQLEQKMLDKKIERLTLEQSLNDTDREGQLELARLIAERTEFEAEAVKKRSSAKKLENNIDKQIAEEQKRRLEERRKQ
jgi:hypothetical protein